MARKNKRRKEEICEWFCFSCKDGGDLIICEYKDCLKAYHPECVGKDKSFLESAESWSCDWHSCFICNKSSKFRCLCCSLAVCGRCVFYSEFVVVKGAKGFCQNCLRLASLIEHVLPPDSEEVRVDFEDEETYEFFFANYWENIKKKEGLNKEHVRSANELLRSNCNYRSDPYFLGTEKIDGNAVANSEEEEEEDCIVSDYEENKPGRKRGFFKNKADKKKKGKERSKKIEFVGWGSKSLLEFLDSVGEETSKPMVEHEVISVVIKYCIEKKLFDPLKKKRNRILCDETLRLLLKRKIVFKNSLNNLLAVHFASNLEDSTGDEVSDSVSSKEAEEKQELVEVQKKCCYAMVNSENLKLVYLKRSLLEELLKKPLELLEKVVGSFVRVKCNPNDYLQKNSHQLLQVSGITASITGQILLQFSDCHEEFPLEKFSNDDFTKEECEDLRDRMNNGVLKKLTVVELEQKARSLHKDMINHWIPKEMELLQRRIDLANEKGWKRELSEYLDRIKVLGDESERQRLFNNLPEIIAEPLVDQNFEKYDINEYDPVSSDYGSDNFSYESDTNNQECVASADENPIRDCRALELEVGDNALKDDKMDTEEKYQRRQSVSSSNEKYRVLEPGIDTRHCERPISKELLQKREDSMSSVMVLEYESTSKVELIELSDSEAEPETPVNRDLDSKADCRGPTSEEIPTRSFKAEILCNQPFGDVKESELWYCRTAHGRKAGPFKMSTLSKCLKTRDRDLQIKVWKKGSNEEQHAVFLGDAIRQFFHGT